MGEQERGVERKGLRHTVGLRLLAYSKAALGRAAQTS